MQIKIAMNTAHTVRVVEEVDSYTATGRERDAAMEAAETRPDQQMRRTNTRMAMKNAIGEIMRKQPAAVATPLPPSLKFKYMGKR